MAMQFETLLQKYLDGTYSDPGTAKRLYFFSLQDIDEVDSAMEHYKDLPDDVVGQYKSSVDLQRSYVEHYKAYYASGESSEKCEK